jgi:hypothetical protein
MKLLIIGGSEARISTMRRSAEAFLLRSAFPALALANDELFIQLRMS